MAEQNRSWTQLLVTLALIAMMAYQILVQSRQPTLEELQNSTVNITDLKKVVEGELAEPLNRVNEILATIQQEIGAMAQKQKEQEKINRELFRRQSVLEEDVKSIKTLIEERR